MAPITKKNEHIIEQLLTNGGKEKAVINPNMKDLSKDPYFVKEAEAAKQLLDKYGVPKK